MLVSTQQNDDAVLDVIAMGNCRASIMDASDCVISGSSGHLHSKQM